MRWKSLLLKRPRGIFMFLPFGALCIILYFEFLSHGLNSLHWFQFPKDLGVKGAEEEPLRILFVADPQILGESDEPPLLGSITRWDADRYIRQNYRLAKAHIKPHVVVFLGDLLDEGSKAQDAAYRRYSQRFISIFDIPKSSDPSPIEYIYIPGDNDIGGENEPVSPIKLIWFGLRLGDPFAPYLSKTDGMSLQFWKINSFIPPTIAQEPPEREMGSPDYRIVLSHLTFLPLIKESKPLREKIEKLRPSLIVSGDKHTSAYLHFSEEMGNVFNFFTRFLLQSPDEIVNNGGPNLTTVSRGRVKTQRDSFNGANAVRIELRKSTGPEPAGPQGLLLQEITVPTCSYRMGVPNMGFGAMQIFKNGTADYSVLWLPSRFNQLTVYAGFYILMKLVLTPWILCQCLSWAKKIIRCRSSSNNSVTTKNKSYNQLV